MSACVCATMENKTADISNFLPSANWIENNKLPNKDKTKSNYLCVSAVLTRLWLRRCCNRVLKLNCLFVSRKFSCDSIFFLGCSLAQCSRRTICSENPCKFCGGESVRRTLRLIDFRQGFICIEQKFVFLNFSMSIQLNRMACNQSANLFKWFFPRDSLVRSHENASSETNATLGFNTTNFSNVVNGSPSSTKTMIAQ